MHALGRRYQNAVSSRKLQLHTSNSLHTSSSQFEGRPEAAHSVSNLPFIEVHEVLDGFGTGRLQRGPPQDGEDPSSPKLAMNLKFGDHAMSIVQASKSSVAQTARRSACGMFFFFFVHFVDHTSKNYSRVSVG